MRKFLIRLDDASEIMHHENWNKMERLLDKYAIKPLVAVIPKNQDLKFQKFKFDIDFWSKVKIWQEKGWEIGLHGYTHVFDSDCGGINPINNRSEFAGYNGLICASDFGLWVPPFSVQTVPLFTVRFVPL